MASASGSTRGGGSLTEAVAEAISAGVASPPGKKGGKAKAKKASPPGAKKKGAPAEKPKKRAGSAGPARPTGKR